MTEYFDFWKLFAGLGLFLFGMNLLESGLKSLSGKGFKKFLRQSTDKPIGSVFGGIIATTIVQSSSLVGLIVLAFVGAGIIPLVNAIGVIIGSNLGTTFTGWIVTTLGFKLNFSNYIYPLIAFSGLTYGLSKGRLRYFCLLLLGFALLLMGLDFMKESVELLAKQMDISQLAGYPLIVYLIVGVIFTAIIQSSSAAMMLTLSALYAGIISLPAAAALVIGADLGTTSTVFLGSLQGGTAKRRLAMAHILFNLSVDAIAFIFLYPILALITWLNLTDPLYSLVAFHSLFNLFGLILFLPLIRLFAKKLEDWFPENRTQVNQYIQDVPVVVIDAAIEALEKETKHLLHMVLHLNLRYLDKKRSELKKIEKKMNIPSALIQQSVAEEYLSIKELEGEIIDYGLKIKLRDGSDNNGQSEELAHKIDNLMNAARSGVYSAKAFKDIEQDLVSFHEKDNDYFSQSFVAIKNTAITMNETISSLIGRRFEQQILEDDLVSLTENLHQFHQQTSDDIYNKNSEANLSPIELSTLLNVNKEIQTSAEALIKSLRLL